jgi:mannose-6-phosphate isomerase-like protein (cupin superfamily)
MRSLACWSIIGVLSICTSTLAQAPQGAAQRKTGEVRRIVTKIDEAGKAIVMFNDQVPLVAARSPNGVGEIWVTEKSPAELSWNEDRAHVKVGIAPPRNGTVFRVVDFPPITPEVENLDRNTLMRVVGEANTPAKGLPPRHSMMHRTRSLDYAIVLSGEIDMLLDDGEVHLKAGDVLVQQATNHAWVNRSKEICRIAFILIDSQEP